METLLDPELVVEEQTEEPIPCSAQSHATNEHHVPEQFATWTVLLACGCVLPLCDAFVQCIRNSGVAYIACFQKHTSWLPAAVFVPIA